MLGFLLLYASSGTTLVTLVRYSLCGSSLNKPRYYSISIPGKLYRVLSLIATENHCLAAG